MRAGKLFADGRASFKKKLETLYMPFEALTVVNASDSLQLDSFDI